jgi:hypothetical protein
MTLEPRIARIGTPTTRQSRHQGYKSLFPDHVNLR